MKKLWQGAAIALVLTGCAWGVHVKDGPDGRDDRDRRARVTTTTEQQVNCAALGCPGNPPA